MLRARSRTLLFIPSLSFLLNQVEPSLSTYLPIDAAVTKTDMLPGSGQRTATTIEKLEILLFDFLICST